MTALMTPQMAILLVAYVAVVLGLAVPMGRWLAAIAEGRLIRTQRLDSALLRACGTRPEQEQGWRDYAVALLVFNVIGVIVVYGLQRLQGGLPLNPQGLLGIAPDSAFNTAISFVTNTNWQGYSGEVAMGYAVQMLGLAVQNFLSAATGIAVAVALIRGFARGQPKSGAATIGNFWVDVTRITLYVLLPLSLVFAVVLSSQGVLQNVKPYTEVALTEPVAYTEAGPVGANGQPTSVAKIATSQILPMGPIASQEAIKLICTNGGGFLNANSAHPFENPTPWTNVLQMLAIFVIPAGLCLAFGQMVGDRRQGWALLIAMTVIFVAAVVAIMAAEQSGNPKLAALGVDQSVSVLQSGGNMEGKESRFGIAASALFAAVTTAASCGAVNGMHGSFTPLGGAVPLLLMQLGEVVFGGVGSGLYGMLIFAVLAVFLAGLMIGRTPEYLGKKIEPTEMKLVAIAILMTPLLVLLGTAIAVSTDTGRASLLNPGAPSGTPITLSATHEGGQIAVEISDSGPGLPIGISTGSEPGNLADDASQRLFDKFTRGEKESSTPGVGLGLAICRAIVQAHGGRIGAVNRTPPAHGAVFPTATGST